MTQELNDMLSDLKSASGEIQSAIDSMLFMKGPEGMRAYYDIGERHGQKVMEIFYKLFILGIAPNLEKHRWSKYLVKNIRRDSGVGPESIKFWKDPDSIRTLFEILEKEGFYKIA